MTKKSELLEQATELGLDATAKNTIAEIEQALSNATNINNNDTPDKEEKLAKSGKHSAKGIKESEEKQAKMANVRQQKSEYFKGMLQFR